MHGAWNLFPERYAKVLDLFTGDRSPFSFASHESEHARRPQNLQALLSGLNDPHKRITTEHRHIHFSSPVTPLVDLLEEWKKRENSLFQELPSNPLLMPRLGLNRIPLGLLQIQTHRRL
jgi:hypothetical protein